MSLYFRAFLAALLLLASAAAFAGSATVTWTPPTTRTDGSPLTNLAGYRIYHGTSPTAITTRVDVTSATATSQVLTGLPAGLRYFQMTAVDANGVESARTNAVSTTIVDAPPSAPGNVQVTVQVADTNAYKLRQSVDGFAMVAFGTVPVGTVCDTTKAVGEYALIPRATVTPRSKFEPLPLMAFARCG